MNKGFVFVILLAVSKLSGYVGPHFNYVRIQNERKHLQGYEGGVTTEVAMVLGALRFELDVEMSMNAGPVAGRFYERSDLEEVFLEIASGGNFNTSCCSFFPYVGLGWDRLIRIKDPKLGGFKYAYNTLFIPTGFVFIRHFSFIDLGLEVEYRIDIENRLRLVFEDVTPDPGYGLGVEFPIIQKYRCFTLSFVPFFDWNQFGRVVDVDLNIPPWVLWKLGLRFLIGCKW